MFTPPPPKGESDRSPNEGGLQRSQDPVDRAYRLLRNGMPPKKLRQKLVAEGYTTEEARLIVEDAQDDNVAAAPTKKEMRDFADALKAAGQKNMAIGGLICVVGLIITLVTLSNASGPGGGRYVIAWGAIIFGAIQFFRGISQISQSGQFRR